VTDHSARFESRLKTGCKAFRASLDVSFRAWRCGTLFPLYYNVLLLLLLFKDTTNAVSSSAVTWTRFCSLEIAEETESAQENFVSNRWGEEPYLSWVKGAYTQQLKMDN